MDVALVAFLLTSLPDVHRRPWNAGFARSIRRDRRGRHSRRSHHCGIGCGLRCDVVPDGDP